ncbi:hypothetical protein ABZS47_07265 [Moraxella catarrhalis]|uniref:hypothetical protein n=1 Tax=Moraxella catarrhalis TaxID=480 RepID=UPI000202B107|nr:hypothetical protein [Moraxella catarrhalis]AXT96750.1 hypothetical protein SQ01_05705 [Moraxella catarrhalis]EGE15403.1 hypothetical protein E9K_03311 [Moraxella catarrhalis 103P14B1]EGE26937.1 hypothetical protein E9Y_00886 [Moraxella catarrhalis 101P30B1]MPW56679.1 hypothetical protein [Moraxella catarrhalis]MPW59857.1 hypothetical protein [Moraxella catarrhalis]
MTKNKPDFYEIKFNFNLIINVTTPPNDKQQLRNNQAIIMADNENSSSAIVAISHWHGLGVSS